MQQFTDAKARKLSAPGFHTVDTTLYLRITDRSKYYTGYSESRLKASATIWAWVRSPS